MKKFVLFTFLGLVGVVSYAQVTYTTAASGNFSANATWVGGAAGKPPQNNLVTCACKIVVSAGHQLTMDASTTLDVVHFKLVGVNSILTFANNVDITLTGSSSIDIQSTQARIIRGNQNNNILFGTTTIYDGGTNYLGGTTNGRVDGLASAASIRANPQFQAGVLPVKLTEFVASKSGKGVSLSWKTTQEVNSSHFEIERSADGKSFSTIGQVSAAGNTGVEQSYSYSDGAPADGANYYRLKIVDIDAKFEYSPIKSVSFAASALNVVVGPNPATSFINVKVSAPGNEPYRLRLINRAGQVVFDQKYNSSGNQVQLNVANYADGTYFVEVSNTSGLRQLNKVMIVRK